MKVTINLTNKLTTAIALGVLSACTSGAGSSSFPAEPFQAASARFEQNATDSDVEVVFEVTSGVEGLAELTIVSPDGRTVASFRAPDGSTLGIRTFHFESPEPSDVEGLKAAYPEGVYRFSGKTISGMDLRTQATLSHTLPRTAMFVHPVPGAGDVPIDGVELTWNAVGGVAQYIVEIEQDDLNVNLTARLPRSATTFMLPNGFLVPDTEYQMVIGTVTVDGNITFVESTFTTAG